MSDISTLNVAGLLAQVGPVGPSRSDDTSIFTTGTVYEVDPEGARVRVGVRDGVVWLPAVADRYSGDSLARVMVDPITARPVLVVGAVKPRRPAVLGLVLSGPSGGGNLGVRIDGIEYSVPAPTGAYSIDSTAWILLDEWGVPFLAVGPSSTTPPPAPTPTAPPAPTTATATATIGPQVSGTYSAASGRWDQWNAGRYGGASDIYQGNGYGSGPLIGFAGYGEQLVNLGAVSIDEIVLSARKTADGNSAVLSVQGSGSGGRPGGAPAGSGDVVSSGPIGSGQFGGLAFTAGMREAFRTGAMKGLVAVGGQYGGFGGTSTPGSFVLQIRYTRNV
ncbi:hypothetical protein [uncultured Microbacterium sp.]|uniref:hypothetical protein n=1 Tax=uncultured Microbacterium sp. TaxID=191216 RepID=UPI0025E73F83|nr:hypothetical protein [uncultured Microbacterium sp.]